MMTNMFSSIQQTQLKILDRLEKLESKQQMETRIEDMVDSKIKEAMTEAREKENRKFNLIITNMREAEGTNLEEKKQRDTEQITRVLEDIAQEEVQISNPVRLGKPNIGTRPRLLRITVKTEESKRKILRNASKVNINERDPKKRMYINPDYTLREREAHKKLRQGLKDRIAAGETNLMINYKNGTIIPRPPQGDKGDTDLKEVSDADC